ncbi:CHASE2 domain-containing protein [Candidatus Nitrospira allomarina]|uniref:Adenylate/guanylate cyclase domain-containing protein n=1 Tax=Candidatus Nitrospira allomarina TaxID=3020900 RepID=A0AA96GE99_9BACT|nr:adenylate/guanylate cyclase domain-containing protein [Candidatus Nitrospira allomarina]WNM58600.1 adenylate/guanylate cyclase domain-containing protein [Candidatus Nitrospira allomarina]
MGHSPLRSPAFQIGVITFLVFLGVMGLRWEGFLESAELDAYDWSMRLRPTTKQSNPPITLVSITDQDIRTLGHWPVTDAVLARALDVMATHYPRAIGVDMYRDLEVPPGRQELDRILEAHPEILMVMKFGKIEKGGIPGPAILQGTDRLGFNDVVVDSGGIVRRGLLFLDDGTNFYRSFSLLLALQYLQQEKIVPKPAIENSNWLQLGKTVIRPFEAYDGGYLEADAQGYQYLLDLERGKNVFPTISFGDILAGTFNPELLQDHIVLVGVIAQGVKDYFYTSQCGTLTVCPPIPGLELHGYMVHQLLRLAKGEGQAPIATFPDSLEAAWIGLWVLGGGFIGVWVRGAWRFSLAMLMGMLLLSGVVVTGMRYGVWIPFIPPVIGLVVNAMVVTAWLSNQEKQDRALLMSLFSRHVSTEVAQAVWEKREQFLEKGRLRPQKLVVTTLFTDLEGFTTVAENMEPDTVLDWLNTYMERMVKIITNHGGMVDDYHGDMIKADFGVFRLGQMEADKRQDVNNAVSCAVALEQEMRHLNTQWQQQGLPEVRMRIGIQTGPVVVGSLGSEQRLKFTTIGDSVNVASRLESFQKDSLETWPKDEVCRILIGETTKHYLGDHPWRLKEVGMITLRGKAKRISVYRLFTKTGSLEPCSVTSIEQARG